VGREEQAEMRQRSLHQAQRAYRFNPNERADHLKGSAPNAC